MFQLKFRAVVKELWVTWAYGGTSQPHTALSSTLAPKGDKRTLGVLGLQRQKSAPPGRPAQDLRQKIRAMTVENSRIKSFLLFAFRLQL
jgi:hypothetical protein